MHGHGLKLFLRKPGLFTGSGIDPQDAGLGVDQEKSGSRPLQPKTGNTVLPLQALVFGNIQSRASHPLCSIWPRNWEAKHQPFSHLSLRIEVVLHLLDHFQVIENPAICLLDLLCKTPRDQLGILASHIGFRRNGPMFLKSRVYILQGKILIFDPGQQGAVIHEKAKTLLGKPKHFLGLL